ncbi:MAG: asparagine synthase C-terminal domain-containing protein [Actinobacteria bacterium]|nr:asparagine synthase C-terminal domain-containing protein [Actinomycetota bacterium]
MIEELEKIIIQNIKKIPQVPLSLLLSGGIDSSLVLALLRKVYPYVPISTFTLSKSKDYPDIVFAREIASLFGTEHNEIILSDEIYRNFLSEYNKVKKYDFKGDINIYILCSFAKSYSTTIVTGDGGDECFGGYWLHEYPLGHKETGKIKSFEDIHPAPRKHLEEMICMGFRDFLFKEKSQPEDYDAVWEYFVKCLAPRHLDPLFHTTNILNVEAYTPLYSESLLNFLRTLPYYERIGRKIEKQLASMYLPDSIVERESIGFDIALGRMQ